MSRLVPGIVVGACMYALSWGSAMAETINFDQDRTAVTHMFKR